jgi:protein-S-isoprenylcysteine O-methyltransferase Ste14
MGPYAALAFLFGSFALLHSLTAARWFKERAVSALERTGIRYRLFYNLLSVLTAFPFTAYWLANRGGTPLLLSLGGAMAVPLLLLKLGGAALMAASLLQMGVPEFLGLREEERRGLVTTGLYSRVRHPMYLGAVLLLWASAELRSLDAWLYLLATLYLAFGIFLEEERLLGEFGEVYQEYRSRVPAVLPRIRSAPRLNEG